MNWVTGVKYNGGGTIAEVEVRGDGGGVMGLPTRATRQQVITAIDGGVAYTTAYQQAGKWVRGEAVRAVAVGYERYLRTDSNAVRADNLGNLPRLA
jgi:hypothetical protein